MPLYGKREDARIVKRHVERVLDKIEKLDLDQIRFILSRVAEKNELYDTVFDSLNHGVIVLDDKHKVLIANRASSRLIPFADMDSEGQFVWEVVSDREIASFLNKVLNSQEKVVDRDFPLGNGHTRIIACAIMPLVRSGSIRGSLIHLEDVTEKRTKEARLRRAESLAALTTLTAGVAHEIKNPLGSIGIHIQLIQKRLKEKDFVSTDEIEKYLSVINEEVNRLNKVVLDFLFAVRPIDTQPELRDPNQVIRELLDFLKYELQEAKVALKTGLNEVPYIELDEKYIKQAMLNIIQNALSAMPDGGILNIQTCREDEMVVISITDTGTGIPEEKLDKIFEPYFTTRDFGSGLGLTLVYKIVKEHHGEVVVKSREGEGTTFLLSFPVPQRETRLLEQMDGSLMDEVEETESSSFRKNRRKRYAEGR